MKKKVFFFLLLGSFLLNAHPPKSLDLDYNFEKATLAVKVWHNVGNPKNHHIKTITVFLDKEQIAEKTYEQQQTDKFQEEVFDFSEKPLKKGEPIKVRAVCSIMGKKTVDLEWK